MLKHNPFKGLKKREWALLITSLIVVITANLLAKTPSIFTILGTVVGVFALIFVARGDVWGQILCIVFAILYSVTSFQYKYYGEIITYLGMSAPIALISTITWLKHPYEGGNVVEVHKLTKRQTLILAFITALVTSVFYFILKLLNTPNLIISTLSVTTSFLASALTVMRSPYYALAYGANDIVLIVLWILASINDISYLPMIACFMAFLFNDGYGFISWKVRQKAQQNN